MCPFPGIKSVKGRRGCPARDSEQRTERVERIEASIEAKRELVEIGLEMLGADPVMDAVDPGLQVGENQVDDRQEFLRDLRVSAFGDCVVVRSALSEASIAAPVVGDDQRSGSGGVFDESAERMSATVGDDSETNTPRGATVFPIVAFGSRLPATHLYRVEQILSI